jgi:streptogramin lyase
VIGAAACVALSVLTVVAIGACGDGGSTGDGPARAATTSGRHVMATTVAEPHGAPERGVGTDGEAVDLVSDGRSLWVLTCERECAAPAGGSSGRILRVDARSGRVRASTKVPSSDTLAIGPSGLVALDFLRGVVRGYDPATLTARGHVGLRLPFAVAPGDRAFLPLSAAVGRDAVWLTSGRGALARLDPAVDHVESTIRLGGMETGVVLASDDGAWIAEGRAGLAHVAAGSDDLSTIPLGEGSSRLAVNNVIDAGDAVIAAGSIIESGGLTGRNAFAAIDMRDRRVTARGALPPGRVAAAFVDGSLWAGSVGSRTILQITLADGRVERHRLDQKVGWPLAFADGHLWTITDHGALRELDEPGLP